VDAKIAQWHTLVPTMDDRFVPGLDVSGTVLEVGAEAGAWQPGDRVLYHGNMRRPHGGFAEIAVADARTLLPHPDASPTVAAATPCAAWTAYRALYDKLHVRGRQSLLLVGASGGVGSFALQMARHEGVPLRIAVCSQANHDDVHSLGATHTIDYRTQDVLAEVSQLTAGVGVEVAFDAVGGPSAALAASALAFDGHLLELVDIVDPHGTPDPFGRSLSFHQLSLGAGYLHGLRGRETIRKAGRACNAWLESEVLHPPRIEVIPFDRIPDALQALQSQRTVGKWVAQM